MKTKALFLTFLLAGLFAASIMPVLGTTIPKMDLRALVKASDRILQGKVDAVDVEVVVEEGQRRPYTRVRIRVDDPIYARRGDRRQAVFLRFLGGVMDTNKGPVEVAVSGMPQFRLGDNVILFLRENADGTNHQVVGLNQGKYLVVNEVAVSNISGVELVDPKTGKALPGAFTESAPVEAFKAKIRELLK
jgi:hypothetical protein